MTICNPSQHFVERLALLSVHYFSSRCENGVCKTKTIYKRICTHIWVSLFRSFSSSSKIMHSHRFGSALDFWLEGPKVRYLFSSWIRFYDLIICFSFCWRKGILNIYTGFALLSKHFRWIMNTKSVALNLYHRCNIAFLLAIRTEHGFYLFFLIIMMMQMES